MRQFTLVVVVLLSAVLATGSCATVQDRDDVSLDSLEAQEDLSEEPQDESDEAGNGRNALVTTAKESKTSSLTNLVKTTKVKVKPVVEKVVEKVKPIVNKVVHPIVQKVVKQPQMQKIYQMPAVQQQMGVPQNHIDVLPMSSGMYAVAVDNMMGSHINYLGLNRQIQLLPQEVQGINQYVFPAQDMASHQQVLVHLGSPNGHLVLSDLNIGGQVIHGFQGWDNHGQVIVPVHGNGAQMFVEPTAYRAVENTFSYSRV